MRRVRMTQDYLHGDVDVGYGGVADVFRQHFADGKEIGAALAVYREGRRVVDLWGGFRNLEGEPWRPDTLVPVFSTTKGMSSMVIAVAHSRGWLDFDEAVATYWPEFAQHDKQDITVRQLLAHQAGLAALDTPLDREVLADSQRLSAALAGQAPLWEPGTRQGYHAWTLGFYEGELIRRVDPDGRTLGTVFAEEVAGPLGIDFHIGLPDEVGDERLATYYAQHPARGLLHLHDVPRALLIGLMIPWSLTSRAFMTLPVIRDLDQINDRDLLRLELPAAGGVGSARGIARAYSALATGGAELGLSPRTLEAFETPVPPPPGGRRDAVLRFDIVFSLGYVKPYPDFPLGSSDRSYGMAGAGGSMGFADPDLELGYAYTPNRMGFGNPTDPREVALRDALYQALNGPPQFRPGSRRPRRSQGDTK